MQLKRTIPLASSLPVAKEGSPDGIHHDDLKKKLLIACSAFPVC